LLNRGCTLTGTTDEQTRNYNEGTGKTYILNVSSNAKIAFFLTSLIENITLLAIAQQLGLVIDT
jgi:hypothetical protein